MIGGFNCMHLDLSVNKRCLKLFLWLMLIQWDILTFGMYLSSALVKVNMF